MPDGGAGGPGTGSATGTSAAVSDRETTGSMPVQRVCFPFVGDTVGGSHLSALLLAQALPSPFTPCIVVHEQGPLSAYLDREGIAYHQLPLPRYVGRSRGLVRHVADIAASVWPVLDFLRQQEIALVNPQDGRMNMTWMLPARLAGRGLVWHQRSMFAPSRPTSLMLRGAHRVVCVSAFVAESMLGHCRERIAVIDDPHDTSRPPPDRAAARTVLKDELGVGDDTPLVGFFANLTRQKRPDVFVEAAARTCGPSAATPLFLLFGRDYDGLASDLERRAAELGIAEQVRIMGFRTPAETLMAACDVIAAPGVNDAFPRVLIEAMQVGTPLVAARSGGHPDILEDQRTALLFEPDDPLALARALGELLVSPDRRAQLSLAARTAALERFSVARHVEEMVAVYAGIVSRKAAEAPTP